MEVTQEIAKIDREVQTSLESVKEQPIREEAEQELLQLRQEKSLLEQKIKGYMTLSDICHEYKEDAKRLQQEYNKLKDKVSSQDSSMKTQPRYSESPTPVDDPEKPQRCDLEQRINQYDPITSSHDNNSTNALGKIATDITHTNNQAIRTSELYDVGPSPTKSSEGIKSIPNVTNTESETQKPRQDDYPGLNQEKYPMQESIVQTIDSLISDDRHQEESLTGLGFEQVSDNLALGQSAGTSEKGRDLMNFSGAYSITSDSRSKPGPPSDVDLQIVLKSIKQEDNAEGKEVIKVISKYVNDTKKKFSKSQNMNHVLIEKNSELQKKIRVQNAELERVLTKLQKVEHELHELSMSRSKSPESGWVHVEKTETQKTAPSTTPQTTVLQATAPQATAPTVKPVDVEKLMDQVKQLKEANQRWSNEWEKLQKHFENKIADLQTDRDRLTRENTEHRIEEDAKQRDFEKMLMVSKKRANDEENAKEEALLQLTSANNRLDALQTQLADLMEREAAWLRGKQTQQPLMTGSQTSAVPSTRQTKTQNEYQTDIDVLRQQLLLFQEDFDRERQDRATAQSIKEEFKKQNDSLKKKCRHLEQKVSTVERQQKVAEDTSRRTLQENERLQQELSDMKNQLQRERENHRQYVPQFMPQQPPVIQSAGIHPPPQPPPQTQTFLGQRVYAQPPAPPAQNYRMAPQYPANYPTGPQQQGNGNVMGSQYHHANQTGKQSELLPGAWSCNQCTYVNYPGRTVCEMCGYIQNPTATSSQNQGYNGHMNDTLRPRGDEQQQQRHGNFQFQRTPGQNDITVDGDKHVVI